MQDAHIGLDSTCGNHIFGNSKLLNDVVECEPVSFLGMSGEETLHEIGNHSVWGKAYVRPGSNMLNFLSMSQLESTPGFTIQHQRALGRVVVTVPDGSRYVFSSNGDVVYTKEVDNLGTVSENHRMMLLCVVSSYVTTWSLCTQNGLPLTVATQHSTKPRLTASGEPIQVWSEKVHHQ
jgi:hypothetical protein